MYQKYYTDALVLRSRESSEADRIYILYTKDFGLITARASAARRENSRMRYALQSYSRANVALVRGKRGWRAAGASSVYTNGDFSGGVPTFARISELLLRLVTGEEQNEYLFSALADAHEALISAKGKEYATIEIVCVARILYALGYLSLEALETDHASFSTENVRDPASRRLAPALQRGPTPVSLFTHTAYDGGHLQEAEVLREKLISRINSAIAEAQL